jgi:hypothetical protein
VAGGGYAGLMASGFSLIGDFDMKVDFTLIDWPTNNGAQLAIGMQPTQLESFLCMLGRANSNGNEQYFTIFLNNFKDYAVIRPTNSGKLRLVRTGNQVEAFIWNGADWQSVGSYTDASLGAKVAVFFSIGPYDNNYSGIPAKAAFDNIQITYTRLGPSLWQGNTAPAIMLLLNSQ